MESSILNNFLGLNDYINALQQNYNLRRVLSTIPIGKELKTRLSIIAMAFDRPDVYDLVVPSLQASDISLLVFKASVNPNPRYIQKLHQIGLDLNKRYGESDFLIIEFAISTGSLGVVEYLVKNGATVTDDIVDLAASMMDKNGPNGIHIYNVLK